MKVKPQEKRRVSARRKKKKIMRRQDVSCPFGIVVSVKAAMCSKQGGEWVGTIGVVAESLTAFFA